MLIDADLILFDSPPVMSVTDPLVLASQRDLLNRDPHEPRAAGGSL